MSDGIEPGLRTFIAENIGSVAQLELLLLLHQRPEEFFSADDAARVLALAPEMTAGLLAALCRHGFAGAKGDAPACYHYAPLSAQIDTHVQQLAELYKQRRVSVIQLIYSQPVDKLRIFADAFRLRKREDH